VRQTSDREQDHRRSSVRRFRWAHNKNCYYTSDSTSVQGAGHKRKELAGGWTRLHNEELHNFYASPNIISLIKSSRMRLAGHEARMGEMRKAYNILVEELEQKRPFGRPRLIWKDNIRMGLREIVWRVMDWMHLA